MSICELMNAHVRYKVENDADSTYEINDFSCTYVAQLQYSAASHHCCE